MTTLSERDVIITSKYTQINFNAPRIEDREMLEQLQKLINNSDIATTIRFISNINEALESDHKRVNLKLEYA